MSMGHWRADSDGPPCLAHRTVRLSLGFPIPLVPYLPSILVQSEVS